MTLSRPARIILLASAALLVLAVYAIFDPSQGFFPRCIFKELTGFDCPGCGSQRAIHALLHGRVVRAWQFNPMVILSIPLLGILALPRSVEWAERLRRSRWLPPAVLAAVTGWWVLRNLSL